MISQKLIVCSLLLCFVGGGLGMTTVEPIDVQGKATNFLKRFGYLKEGNENDEVSLEDAIKAMQEFSGIKQTGRLDDATLALMNTPRCSQPDMDASEGKAKRYVYVSKWDTTVLDYKIWNYPTLSSSLANTDVDRIISNAWAIWSNTAKTLSFPLSTSASPTMNIKFLSYNHSCRYPFDGPGGALAHGLYPTGGNIHFDDSETWSDGQTSGKNLAWTATHEFGHSLGLGHSTVMTALMYPYYSGYKPTITLDPDDVTGILSIYPN